MSIKFFKNPPSQNFTRFVFPDEKETLAPAAGISSFNFPSTDSFADTELEVDAEEIIDTEFFEAQKEEALREAERIIAEAENRAAEIEEKARELGLAQAQERFEIEVETQVNEKVEEIRDQMVLTIHEISNLYVEISNRAEKDLIELALEIARKVVQREVTIDREIVLTLTKVTLGKLHRHAIAKVYLNPEDFAFVEKQREKLNFHGALELVEDRSISLGGCLIRTDAGDFDARIESQFEEISRGLIS